MNQYVAFMNYKNDEDDRIPLLTISIRKISDLTKELYNIKLTQKESLICRGGVSFSMYKNSDNDEVLCLTASKREEDDEELIKAFLHTKKDDKWTKITIDISLEL